MRAAVGHSLRSQVVALATAMDSALAAAGDARWAGEMATQVRTVPITLSVFDITATAARRRNHETWVTGQNNFLCIAGMSEKPPSQFWWPSLLSCQNSCKMAFLVCRRWLSARPPPPPPDSRRSGCAAWQLLWGQAQVPKHSRHSTHSMRSTHSKHQPVNSTAHGKVQLAQQEV